MTMRHRSRCGVGTAALFALTSTASTLASRRALAEDHGGYVAISGIRVNIIPELDGTDLSPEDAAKHPAGILVWEDATVWGASRGLSGRVWLQGGLGAGSTGFEGELGGGLSIGGYIPIDAIDEGAGPFARLGFDGEMMGNQELYVSWFELPQARAGFQIGNSALEIGAHSGIVLAGHFNLGYAARRDEGVSVEYGPYLALGPIDISWMHILAGGADGSPVDVFRAKAGIVDVWYVHGATTFGVPTQTVDSTAILVGICLGYPQRGSL